MMQIDEKTLSRGVVLAAALVGVTLIADIASLRIVMVAGLSIDGGTFLYPIMHTLRDLVHKTIGNRATRALIYAAAVINISMFVLFWLVAGLPPDLEVGPQTAFVRVLGPLWRIATAGLIAEILSQLVDTWVYELWVTKVTVKYHWSRVWVTNFVSQPIDSLLFSWIAFGGLMPASVVWSIVLSNILIKGGTTLVAAPLIYAVPEVAHKHLETQSRD
jgi:queuosine precursor transporter